MAIRLELKAAEASKRGVVGISPICTRHSVVSNRAPSLLSSLMIKTYLSPRSAHAQEAGSRATANSAEIDVPNELDIAVFLKEVADSFLGNGLVVGLRGWRFPSCIAEMAEISVRLARNASWRAFKNYCGRRIADERTLSTDPVATCEHASTRTQDM